MRPSRNITERSDLVVRDEGQEGKNGVELKERRKRKILGDRTNFSIYGLLQKRKKRKQLVCGEDKENIAPGEEGFLAPTILESTAVRKADERQKAEHQPIFGCDKLRYSTDGHLFAREYVLPIARAMV